MQQLQDTDIIQLVLKGQKNAYSVLVERYRNFVFTIAHRYVSGREEAEELAQDVFVKAYRSLADFKGNSKFSTWLFTITHHTCLSFLRKRKERIVSIDDIQQADGAFVSGDRTLGLIETRSKQALLAKAIQQLSEADAEIITLFYQGEQTLEEIAVVTGQTINNVKIRLFRARQRLKDILEKRYAGELTGLKH